MSITALPPPSLPSFIPRLSLVLPRGSRSPTDWLALLLTSTTGTRSDFSGATRQTGAMNTPLFSLELFSITGKSLPNASLRCSISNHCSRYTVIDW